MEAFEKIFPMNFGVSQSELSEDSRRCNIWNIRRNTWRAAFVNMQQWLIGRRCTGEDMLEYVNKELEDK